MVIDKISALTATLFKKSLLLEAPNLPYFSEQLTNGHKILINLNSLNEINSLPNIFLSSHLNALYQKTILDLELDTPADFQNNKTKRKI